MNKLIIGLLIIAAGTGVFFLLRKKKNEIATNDIKKEWLAGNWKAAAGKDSVFSMYRYEFQKNGNIIRTINDSVAPDTLHYEWTKGNELLWKNNTSDSTGNILTVIKLTQDSLQVYSKDSAQILFTKLK
ncbi:MAG: hypothetical protein ACRDEB_10180 [Chitinophagaceae bacterium]